MSDNIHYLHEPVSIKLERDKDNMEKLEAIFARPELGMNTDDFERFKVPSYATMHQKCWRMS